MVKFSNNTDMEFGTFRVPCTFHVERNENTIQGDGQTLGDFKVVSMRNRGVIEKDQKLYRDQGGTLGAYRQEPKWSIENQHVEVSRDKFLSIRT